METVDGIMRELIGNEKLDYEFLYHYTDVNAFKGIVQNKQLWLSDILSMNDLSEFLHIHEVARDYLEYQVNGGDPDYGDTIEEYEGYLKGVEEDPSPSRISAAENYKKSFIDPEELRRGLEPFYRLLSDEIDRRLSEPRKVTPNIYIMSLSEKGDQLSQWRGYCPRGGYSLGFRRRELRNVAMQDNVMLVKCIYDWKEKCDLVERILTTFHEPILELVRRCRPKEKYVLQSESGSHIAEIIKTLEQFSPIVKHEGFVEEVEWRLVNKEALFPNGQELERQRLYRPRGAILVPYFKLDLDGDFSFSSCFSVTVGPMPNQNEGIAFSREFLGDEGITSGTEVDQYGSNLKVSSIPYRIM